MFDTNLKEKMVLLGRFSAVALFVNACVDVVRFANDTALPTTMTLEETQDRKTTLMRDYGQVIRDVGSDHYRNTPTYKFLRAGYCADLAKYDYPFVPRQIDPRGGVPDTYNPDFQRLVNCTNRAVIDYSGRLVHQIRQIDRMQKGLILKL